MTCICCWKWFWLESVVELHLKIKYLFIDRSALTVRKYLIEVVIVSIRLRLIEFWVACLLNHLKTLNGVIIYQLWRTLLKDSQTSQAKAITNFLGRYTFFLKILYALLILNQICLCLLFLLTLSLPLVSFLLPLNRYSCNISRDLISLRKSLWHNASKVFGVNW